LSAPSIASTPPQNEKEKIMKFTIYKDSAGNYRWRLKSANGQTVASSGEAFASRANAVRAAENVRDNAGGAEID
jgi:uncharacterized protein YegP (UPF0339 family)